MALIATIGSVAEQTYRSSDVTILDHSISELRDALADAEQRQRIAFAHVEVTRAPSYGAEIREIARGELVAATLEMLAASEGLRILQESSALVQARIVAQIGA